MSVNSEITILLVTFVPDLILLKKKIGLYKNFRIIIVDTSPENYKIEKYLKSQKNVFIVKVNNNGQGFANNTGINYSKSKFILYVDLDANFELDKISEIYKYARDIKNWSILIPNSNNKFKTNQIQQIDDCEASVFLINRNVVLKDKMFDENIFFYFEELDYFSRLNLTKYKVLLLPKLTFSHTQGGSVNKSIIEDVSNIQQWHYLWSMFYVYKKKTNYINALKIIFPFITKDILKLFYYLLTLNFKLANKRLYRISGAINSIIGRSSYKRPKNI